MTPSIGETYIPFRRFKGCLIPESLLSGTTVSHRAAVLFGVLARFSGKDGLCFPGQIRLAGIFGVTERTVQRWLRELVSAGFIRTTRRGLGTRTNAYNFVWHHLLDRAQLDLPLPEMPPPAFDPPPAILPCRKPVERERVQEVRSRQKCRVNGLASFSEEGQVFSAPSTVAVGLSIMPVEIPDAPEASAPVQPSLFPPSNQVEKQEVQPPAKLPIPFPPKPDDSRPDSTPKLRPGQIAPMTPVKRLLAALPDWLTRPDAFGSPYSPRKPGQTPITGPSDENGGSD